MVEHRSPKPLMRVRFLQPLPVDYESWKQDFFLFLKEVELPPLFSLFTSSDLTHFSEKTILSKEFYHQHKSIYQNFIYIIYPLIHKIPTISHSANQ